MGLIGFFTRFRLAVDIFTACLAALAKLSRAFVMEVSLIAAFVAFTLWLGSKILDKAGIPKAWVLCLLIPVVNIIMIWVFAFCHWPNLKEDVKQDL